MRRYLIFSIISLVLLLFSISGTAVSVAFPIIISDFNTSLVLAGWILSGFQLVATAVMPLSGKISEALGRRFTFMLCTLLFTIGSVLCAVAPNIGLLIAFRVVQALGVGGFLPCATGIVSDEFPEARQRAIGLFTSIFPIGMIIGPNLGGWLVESLGWRSIFWFNIPFGVVILGVSRLLLQADGKKSGGSIDVLGAGLLIGSLFTLMFGFTELGNTKSGISWMLIGVLFTLSIVLLIAFLRWERRAREPIVDLELLKEKPFLAANVYNLVYGACAFGVFSLIPFYAVSIYGMSIVKSGFILTPRSIGMMVASTVTSFALVRWGYRRPILVGTLTVALSLFLLALELQGINVMGFHLSATMWLLIVMALAGIGVGVSAPAANNACIELMPNRVEMITGLRGMFRQMGGAIGIAISTVLLHNIVDIHRAFHVVLLSLALITLICIPAIFAMPSSPNAQSSQK